MINNRLRIEILMRAHVLALTSFFAAAGLQIASADVPHGTLLELHSCEVYAGGCTVSSQATLEGNYLLRVWSFKGGQHDGTDLSGLKLAALQSSGENLAYSSASAAKTVVYLPQEATPAQRAALLSWFKTGSSPEMPGLINTRVVPLELKTTSEGHVFKAGEIISIKTASLESCESGACGEALWYTPRSSTSVFTVAVNKVSEVKEPMLDLVWRDAGKRSVFLARFGDSPSRPAYVAATDLCAPGSSLF
jgi:hypothetical protein